MSCLAQGPHDLCRLSVWCGGIQLVALHTHTLLRSRILNVRVFLQTRRERNENINPGSRKFNLLCVACAADYPRVPHDTSTSCHTAWNHYPIAILIHNWNQLKGGDCHWGFHGPDFVRLQINYDSLCLVL